MAGHEIFNNETTHANQHSFLSSVSLRNAFLAWLLEGHSQKYAPDILANCLDNISKYALRKKICVVDLWSLSQHSAFQPVYNRILNDKLLRIINRRTYKIFITAGQLYLKFLTDKEYAKARALSNELTAVENTSASIPQDTVVLASTEKHNDMTLFVDFRHPELCAQTRPVNCLIKGRAVVPDKLNWSSLLVAITELFIEENNPNLSLLDRKPMYGSKVFFLPRKADSGNCCKLSNGKWIYTNYNPQAIVTIIGNLCRHCEVDLSDVVISYLPKDTPFDHSAILINSVVEATISPKIMLEPSLAGMIIKVMSSHFPNGYRIDSPIELLRFRRFAAEDFGDEISITDEELIKSISSCGTFFDGKIYIIDNEIENKIKNRVDLAISGCAEIIFYKSFYERHEKWLFAGGVISEEMLKGILVKLYPKYTHKANYFSPKAENGTELSRIKSEIMRVWGSDVMLNYKQLSERLLYIPLDKIRYVLAQNGDFIRNATGVYTHVGKVDVTNEECDAITEYVAVACQAEGYASLSNIPLGEIEERNYELTLTAIYNAVFVLILADKYDRRGKIITRKGDILDALTIMKEHCRTLDKCSLQDLLDFERELTGVSYRLIPMEVGYSVMVRVDEDSYVSEKYVHFDSAEIDGVLDLFVTGDYLPLKSVTTFAAFPHCGQTWNLFLLESYCRRFSNRFRFEVLSFNSKNVGVIVRKNCRLSYAQIMADAVAESDIPLENTAIEEFLYSNGYIGRRSYTKTDELIDQAKAIRERRD
jgi:hypothetical protein